MTRGIFFFSHAEAWGGAVSDYSWATVFFPLECETVINGELYILVIMEAEGSLRLTAMGYHLVDTKPLIKRLF